MSIILWRSAVRAIALAASLSGCSFPSYLVEREGASTGTGGSTQGDGGHAAVAGMAGTDAAGGLAGATTSGGTGSGGSAGGDDLGGAAGSSAANDVQAWSKGALERLGFSLLGAAELTLASAILTRELDGQRGGIVQQSPIALADAPLHIEVRFQIQATGRSGDGVAVVLHASENGYDVIGAEGGALGYGGIAPCLAVEVDTARASFSDLPAPHLAIMSGCNPNVHGVSSSALGGDPRDGTPWLLTVDWEPSTRALTARLRHPETDRDTLITQDIDLVSALGPRAYVAVTAATGADKATQAVTSLHLEGAGVTARTLRSE